MTDVRLCFDVGGTYIKFGFFTEKNQWLDRGKIKTPSNTRDEFFATLAAKIKEVEQVHVIEGIGLSFPGFIDSVNGRAIMAGALAPSFTRLCCCTRAAAAFKQVLCDLDRK